ncbi:proprotein convertase subtilisin/kexin type 5 [Aplochiton taeniatus]
MGQIGDLQNYYSFRHSGTLSGSAVSNTNVTNRITKETQVLWLQQQVALRRTKRNSRASHIYSIDVRTKLSPSSHAQPNQDQDQDQSQTPGQRVFFNDPQWGNLWYIHCGAGSPSCPSHMNIEGAWSRGHTGKGVVVSILDDGLDREHPDLRPNYDPSASYDVIGNDPDPSPRQGSSPANDHGTRCAGIIAAAGNNSECSVGIAFNARIGGIRMLDGDVTDMVEAQSLGFRQQHIDIYSASWGPEDNGRTLEGPGPLARLALENGIRIGRHGRGSVFVWASGNGGRSGDHCSCDGYASSVYTISISSATQAGGRPAYLEQCSSTLATAYGDGGVESSKMVTLGLKRSCNKEHLGTSVSAPMAAGVIALALDANPLLTWRDVQHLIVRTSQADHLDAPDWLTNGAGYKVSHLYGFGLLDAESLVTEAQKWRQVPPQHVCKEGAPTQHSRTIRPGAVLSSVYESSGCSDQPRRRVVYVEHVTVLVTMGHGRRGDLALTLTSPWGTASQLLANRPHDHSTEGFSGWEFMTTHCWGERAAGKWRLDILDTPSEGRSSSAGPGELKGWWLVLRGTAEQPHALHREQARSAELPTDGGDLTEEYSGRCDPECSDDGCEGPFPQQCVTCLHFFLKFKNSTRTCFSACPKGFWGDRRRCKRCYSACESCTGSRSDQCTSCKPGTLLVEGTNSCTASCEDSYFLDHDENACRRCSENCLKCTSSSVCTECQPGTSLQGNRCQRSCGPGFFRDGQESTCQPCHLACATCAGAGMGACSQCAVGYLMEEWRCVSSCSVGFYPLETNPENPDGQRMCRRCDASCLTCVGGSRANCSSCAGGHMLQDGVCVVSDVCKDGEYQDSHGKCHACDTTCLKCTGPQSEACISCLSSRALDEGRCVAECSRGKYQSGGQCHVCDHTCATCLDVGPANCTSCDTDKFGMQRYLYQGRCVDTCPAAHYHTKQSTCEPCSLQCALCSGPTRCLQCNSSFFLSDGFCSKLECGEGEVEDPEYDDCMACEEGCKKCVLYNPKHCLSCTDGFYKFLEGCYKNCPAKTYSVEEEMTCVPCDDNCVSCDQHECYWCETDLFLSEGKCAPKCPDGFYGDEDTQECEECPPDCVTCEGPDSDDCVSCIEGERLVDGECVAGLPSSCPVKTFLSEEGDCEACHASCESCSGEEKNQCKTCTKGHFLTGDQTCVSKCPAGSFPSRPSGVCETCPPGCVQCAGAQRCTRCLATRKAPLFLQDGACVHQCQRGYPVGQVCHGCAAGCASCEKNATHCLSCDQPLLLHKHQCVSACPPGHTLRDGQCERCPTACQECTLQGQCTGCEEYHFLHEGHCVADCPQRFFEDPDQGVCARCHPDCALCDGPGHNDCDTCSDPEATMDGGTCLTPCPPHTYRDHSTGQCEDCDASCLSCSGPRPASCTSCREGQRWDGHGHCGPPADKCPSHHYDDQAGDCHPCHKYCLQCSGPGKTHCLSCNQKHLLLNGTCTDDCPTGYYQEETGLTCEPCHPTCQSCVGRQSHQCLTCRASLFREAKECVETCRHSHYGNVASGACERCDPSCGECFAGGAEGCLSCAAGLLYLRKRGRCLPSCPHGHYHDGLHRTCEPCHASCGTCSGKGPLSCATCQAGYTLFEGLCESMCDVGQYPVLKGYGHDCEPCDRSCLECRGGGHFNCTVCPAQAILAAGGRCLLCCRIQSPEEEEEEGEVEEDEGQTVQDCCNCTETRGECVLSTNLAFRNEEKEEEEWTGNLGLFITASILMVLGLAAVVFLVRRSRSKRPAPDIAPRGYEKLGSGGGYRSGGGVTSSSSYGGQASSSGGTFREARLVDLSPSAGGAKDGEDEDEDEDIVYMGQDGTVYRKFRYGQPGDDNEDELEYDDESYAFR